MSGMWPKIHLAATAVLVWAGVGSLVTGEPWWVATILFGAACCTLYGWIEDRRPTDE